MDLSVVRVASPVGWWSVLGDAGGVREITMPHEVGLAESLRVAGPVREAARQLEQYFAGRRRTFSVALADVAATDFQRAVWEALDEIPYGSVATYAEVAAMVGRPRAARAVGNANHANPWPLLHPCHRVVAAQGLGGYGGGEEVKRFLLDLEGVEDYTSSDTR